MLEFFGNNWLFISFLAPMFWALVNIIDVYFVDGIYNDEYDGTIISSLFQIIPVVVIFSFLSGRSLDLFSFSSKIPGDMILLSLAAGFIVTLSYFFYFKALFNENDVALLQILWGLTIVAVPIISFFIVGEELSILKYFGMAVTLFGASILPLSEKIKIKFSSGYVFIMLAAVILLSVGMVFQEKVYSTLSESLSLNQGFLVGFLLFSLGGFLGGIFFIFIKKRNPFPIMKKFLGVFFIAEGIQFFGTLASQRAIDIAPSVSYVATVETFVPVFILIFSFLIILISKFIKYKKEIAKRIYKEQLDGLWLKVLATIIMALGIYIIN